MARESGAPAINLRGRFLISSFPLQMMSFPIATKQSQTRRSEKLLHAKGAGALCAVAFSFPLIVEKNERVNTPTETDIPSR